MLERFELVVFDWDGTLFDSTTAIARAIQSAAADLGLPVPELARARHVIGLGLQDALARAVPDLPPGAAPEFSRRYRDHYLAAEQSLQLFDGVSEILDAIRAAGVPMAIATGKSRAGLSRVLQSTALGPYFAATRCADQTHPKPHPAMLLELAEELSADPLRILMIGDTTHDLQMAQAAGAAAVGVTYGAHPRSDLARLAPLALFGSVRELHQWLLPG
jgi:phosphoglycolate phosphatase